MEQKPNTFPQYFTNPHRKCFNQATGKISGRFVLFVRLILGPTPNEISKELMTILKRKRGKLHIYQSLKRIRQYVASHPQSGVNVV